MTGWMRRFAASVALLGLLACSGFGMCWTRVVPLVHHHDCCTSAGDRISRPAQPCAGEASFVKATFVPPSAPADAPVAVVATPAVATTAAAFAPSFRVKDPPLVLRI
jgi:hypothetical protein